jgi:hypothetical protein
MTKVIDGRNAMSYGHYGSRSSSSSLGPIGALLLAIVMLAGLSWTIYWYTGPKQGLHYETITVCDMEDSKTSDGHEYRIYASNDTYKMADSWFGVKRRDTANDYGQMMREIKNGPVTYDVTVKGERWNTPTNFGNIVEFTKAAVQTPEKCAAEG